MISADFAPNEQFSDALASLITLFAPWAWKKGPQQHLAIAHLEKIFPGTKATLFLSGRGTLTAALRALKLPQGSQVIVQGFTCEAVVLPIMHLGLKPVYADIEADTFSLDPASFERCITSNTRVVLLQHTFGLVPKYRDRVLQLAREKNILIIEDLAHGFEPGFWQKQHLSDKQLLLLSFGRSKALSSVFGGALLTADREIGARLKQADANMSYPGLSFIAGLLCYKPITWVCKRTYNFLSFGKVLHFLAKKSGLLVAEISAKEKRGEYDPYLEKKYPNALAKLLVRQLMKYEGMMEQRARITDRYKKQFKLTAPSVPSRFPVMVGKRDLTLNDVSKRGIYLGNWYTQPVAPRQLQLNTVMYTMGSCPVAEHVCRHIINLPTLVTEKEAEIIIGQLSLHAD